MQIANNIRKINDSHPFLTDFLRAGDLFLDIETTGLSRQRHHIYLIGTAEFTEDGQLLVRQLFAEEPAQESAILTAFSDELSGHGIRRIITFNGDGFDLPFLLARAKDHGLSPEFDRFWSFDIYKEVLKLKNILLLPNYKQKTIEQFLGCHREDIYSGGELIKVYENYIKTGDPSARQMLLLHNYEDVLGMGSLLPILSYRSFLESEPCITDSAVADYRDADEMPSQELIITLQPPYPLPGSRLVRHPLSDAYLSLGGAQVRMRIPITHGTVRLYYRDYKNYYYLPAEDMAIHKSLATFVDKEHRQKATPASCYTKVTVTDAFLHTQQLTEYVSHVLKSFWI